MQLGHNLEGLTTIMKPWVRTSNLDCGLNLRSALLLVTTNNNLFMLKYYDINIIVLHFLY